MKTILITGAYGFVGTNLATHLKDKYTLWALDRTESKPGLYKNYYSWDCFKSIPFDEIDMVIHLAGKAHDTKGKSEAQVYFDINTKLTQRVYDAFLNSKAKSFIFFSSVKAVADFVETNILTEDIIPKPVGAYGESKIKAEEYILSQNQMDKKVYIFRPCMIHGPGNKGNLNLLYNFIKKGIPYPLGAFENKRSFTSIDNLSYIISKTISDDIPSGIYNIADDEALSSNELIRVMSESLRKKPKIWSIPKKLIRFIASCGNILHLPLNSFRLHKLTENYVVSNEKIKYALNIKALPLSSSNGIKKTVESLKKN